MKTDKLLRFLSQTAKRLGAAEHIHVVGGAVRNHLMGRTPKDIDLVVDSVALGGKDSAWFAKELEKSIPVRTNLTTNQYGVAILSVSGPWVIDGISFEGEVFEIANARKESYGDPSGKGYKPHAVEMATIREDLLRRDFTVNTMFWRLADLENGRNAAEVQDLLGNGREHLAARELVCPVDPNKTFTDDPTRMLRAVKFAAKYGFTIQAETFVHIQYHADKLKQMPWDAVRKILVDDVLSLPKIHEFPEARHAVGLMKDLRLGDVIKEMLVEHPGFATALGRSLCEYPNSAVPLILDIHDLDWPVRSPVSFLPRAEQIKLREVLKFEGCWSPEFEHRFLECLKKPPVDQIRLFDAYKINGQDRGKLLPMARTLLLANPVLAVQDRELERQLEDEVKRIYAR